MMQQQQVVYPVATVILSVNLLSVTTWLLVTSDAITCHNVSNVTNLTEIDIVWDDVLDTPVGGKPSEYDVQGPFLFRNNHLNQTATSFVPGERIWAVMVLRDAPQDTRLRLLEAWACSPGSLGGTPAPYSHSSPLTTGCYTPSLNIVPNDDDGGPESFLAGHRWKVWHSQAPLTPLMRSSFAPTLVSHNHPAFASSPSLSGTGVSFLVDALVSNGHHESAASPVFLVLTWTIELQLTQIASFDVVTTAELVDNRIRHSWVALTKSAGALLQLP